MNLTWYDIRGFFILKLSYRVSLMKQIQFFGRNIKDVHLEAACGNGLLLRLVLWICKPIRSTIIGVDLDPKNAVIKFDYREQIGIWQMDLKNLEFKDDHFDSVNLANAFHCISDVDSNLFFALREIHRVLKPGGTLACNILLHPRRKSIADRINHWGAKKGILAKTYGFNDVCWFMIQTGFTFRHYFEGNCCYVVAVKRWK